MATAEIRCLRNNVCVKHDGEEPWQGTPGMAYYARAYGDREETFEITTVPPIEKYSLVVYPDQGVRTELTSNQKHLLSAELKTPGWTEYYYSHQTRTEYHGNATFYIRV